MSHSLPRSFRRVLDIAVGAGLLACTSAYAADIALYASAIDAGLKKEVFRTEGRHILSGDLESCSYAYLEKPSTSLADGRIRVRMHFSAQVGVTSGSNCLGHTEAFWVTVSGRLYLRGEVVGITDFRLDEGNDAMGPLLENFLSSSVPQVINVNLRQELTKILTANSPPYKVSLSRLELQGLTTERNALRLKFDFSLEGR